MFITVFEQVAVLFILIAIGFILGKKKVFGDKGVRQITDMVLTIVTPCVIIKSFLRPFDKETLKAVLISFLLAFLTQGFFILCSRLLFRNRHEATRRVLHYGMVFTNCGFMSLPLQEAVLGEEGLLYGASYIAIFNLLVWSYGIILMSGDKAYVSPKKLVINPGMIGLAIGFTLFLCSVKLPTILETPIASIAALNTPVPMMIIGYHLSQTDVTKAVKDSACILATLVRLIVLPVLVIAGMYLCGVRGSMLVSMAIACCAPVAANTTMFAAKFEKDVEMSVNLVSLSTLFSLITIPILITLTQTLA